MGRDALIIEAEMALANWKKYESLEPDYLEEVYQANKVAEALRNLIDSLKNSS